MGPMPAVVCVGLVTLDLHQVVSRLPGPNEKTVAESAALEFGGPAANAAATAARLGADATLVTACGDGPVGRLVADGLAAAGVALVDVSRRDRRPEILEQPGRPGAEPAVSSVLVDRRTGDRAVVSTNASGLEVDAELAGPPVAGAGCVLIDGHHPSAAYVAASAARDRGIPVLLDGGSWKPGTDALLGLVDVAVLSGDFRRPDGRDPVEAARAAGCPVVAVSHGAEPLQLRIGDRSTEIRVPRVAVVDTLGAGDVLHGAVAHALAGGADPVSDVEAVLGFAVEVASLSCGYRGAGGWALDEGGARRARSLVRDLPVRR